MGGILAREAELDGVRRDEDRGMCLSPPYLVNPFFPQCAEEDTKKGPCVASQWKNIGKPHGIYIALQTWPDKTPVRGRKCDDEKTVLPCRYCTVTVTM